MKANKKVAPKKATKKKAVRLTPRIATPIEKAVMVLRTAQLNNGIKGSDYLIAMAGFIQMQISEHGVNGTIGVETKSNDQKLIVRFTGKDDQIIIQFIGK